MLLGQLVQGWLVRFDLNGHLTRGRGFDNRWVLLGLLGGLVVLLYLAAQAAQHLADASGCGLSPRALEIDGRFGEGS